MAMTSLSQLEKSPLLLALMQKRVKADVIDLDHYRIRGGMAVETDYIIRIEPTKDAPRGDPQFEVFTLSKTYSAFRTLAHQLKKASDRVTDGNYSSPQRNSNGINGNKLPKSVLKLAQYCQLVIHMVESERTEYLGKVRRILKIRTILFLAYVESSLTRLINQQPRLMTHAVLLFL